MGKARNIGTGAENSERKKAGRLGRGGERTAVKTVTKVRSGTMIQVYSLVGR